MNDREKIIAALENCSDPAGKCRDCPYEECERFEKSISEYPDELIRKAVELLKEQEPRVMTLEEVKKLQSIRDGAIWMEIFGNGLFPALPEFSNKSLTFFVAILFDGYRSVFENDWYGKTWRCWSSRPTDEQRGAVPWTE